MRSPARMPSPAVTLAFIALMVALGGTALAATGQLVNIADGTNAARLAKVDATGKLLVGDGASGLTVDGVVTANEGDLKNAFTRTGPVEPGGCVNLATAPTGKALLVKTLQVDVAFVASGSPYFGVFVGSCSTPSTFINYVDAIERGMVELSPDPGIVVPAGRSLVVRANGANGFINATGLLLPSSALPPSGSALAAEAQAAPARP